MERFLMFCVIAGMIVGLWEMFTVKDIPEEHEDFERGYYKQRRGMFDNFR